MTITQLEYVVAVDNHRHFAKAAEACFVTQPTLSMQIHKLEDELDILIFDRSKQPVTPTEVGKKIIAQARVVITQSKLIKQISQQEKGFFEGDFRIGIIPTISPYLLHRFLSKFQKSMPHINLIVEELQTDQIITQLKKDVLDAAILATPLEENGIIEKPVYYEPFMAYIPEGHRLSKEEFVLNSELKLNDMLLLNEGHCFRNSVLNLCGQSDENHERQFSIESGNFETLIRLADSGYGMTLLPYLAGVDMDKEGSQHIKPIAEPRPTREISVIYRRTQLKIKLVEALIESIKSAVPKKLSQKNDNVVAPV
ncbi:MAG: LysR substrate-binding domain-containing protein [Schleiferiaceae bacterium]|nr:LysR substrate-binding domain-containing protein [Schleiferiaceae bacterium]